MGQNPRQGVTFDYYLDKNADSLDLKLQVMHEGKTIRTLTNKSQKDFKSWPGGPSKPEVLPSKKGYNRFTWDFRKEPVPGMDKVFVYGNYDGSRVGPGTYTLQLSLDSLKSVSEVTVMPNPNIAATPADYEQQQAMLGQIETALGNIHKAVNSMRSAKSQLEGYAALLKENKKAADLLEKGNSLIKRIDSWEQKLIQPQQKTFQDVINYNNQLNAELMNLKDYMDAADPAVTKGARQRLDDLMSEWTTFAREQDQIVNTEMAEYNKLYSELGLSAIIMPE
jgi:hypothetical protein